MGREAPGGRRSSGREAETIHGGVQGPHGAGGIAGRQDAGGACRPGRRSPEPDHRVIRGQDAKGGNKTSSIHDGAGLGGEQSNRHGSHGATEPASAPPSSSSLADDAHPRRVETPQSRCRAGVAQADVTPPAGIYHRMWGAAMHDRSTGVHRPLTVTVLYLSKRGVGSLGEHDKFLVAVDHCLLWPAEMNELLDRVVAASCSGVSGVCDVAASAKPSQTQRPSVKTRPMRKPFSQRTAWTLTCLPISIRDKVSRAFSAYGG